MASVKVAVRVRPINKREENLSSRCIIAMDGNRTSITNLKVSDGPNHEGDMSREAMRVKNFTFDFSFWSAQDTDSHFVTQDKVFKCLGIDVIHNVYQGYNACVFAYGQTGSGKTHTMMGDQNDKGLIPRICEGLFSKMKDDSTSYRVIVSYLEIYNEKVSDLLKAPQSSKPVHSLRVREHPKDGPYVQDLSKHIVNNYSDIEELMNKGNSIRTTASTNMNDTSSRSHAIFTLTFTQAKFHEDLPAETQSKVHLVDLAGSERADSSGATGQRLKEGGSINKSLVTLGNVISVLAEISEKSARTKNTFIPYRNSTLTWLLKDSLGGNAKTVMVATISPADVNYSETMSTLRYANRAKNIINKPTINEDPNVKLIRDLRDEISRLKTLLGGHIDSISTPKVQEKLHENEARVKVLTDEWTGKWRETAHILQGKPLALREEGLGVVLDSDLPHLIGIDDDILSTGIMLFHIKAGRTTIGRADAETHQDIEIAGLDIEFEHCVIENNEGIVTLTPNDGALCVLNGVTVQEITLLKQGSVILLGKTNMFRFNHPAEAAKMRRQLKSPSLHQSRSSLLSQSMSDLTLYRSTENLSFYGTGFEFEQMHREELEKLERKRVEIEVLEESYRHAEEERLAQNDVLQKELEEKHEKLDNLQQDLKLMKEQAQIALSKVEKKQKEINEQQVVIDKEKRELEEEKQDLNEEKKHESERNVERQQKLDDEKASLWRQIEDELLRLAEREAEKVEELWHMKQDLKKETDAMASAAALKRQALDDEIESLQVREKDMEKKQNRLENEIENRRQELERQQQEKLHVLDLERCELSKLRTDLDVSQPSMDDGELSRTDSELDESVHISGREGRLKEIEFKEEQLNRKFSQLEQEEVETRAQAVDEMDEAIRQLEVRSAEMQKREVQIGNQSGSQSQQENGDNQVTAAQIECERTELLAEKLQLQTESQQLAQRESEIEEEYEKHMADLKAWRNSECAIINAEKEKLHEQNVAQEKLKTEITSRIEGLKIHEKELEELKDTLSAYSNSPMLDDGSAMAHLKQELIALSNEKEHLQELKKQQEQEQELVWEQLEAHRRRMELDMEDEKIRLEQQKHSLQLLQDDVKMKLEAGDIDMQAERDKFEIFRMLAEGDPYEADDDGEGVALGDWADWEEDDYALLELSCIEKERVLNTQEAELKQKLQTIQSMRGEFEEAQTKVCNQRRENEERHDSEIDKIDYEKLRLQEMEHQERTNALVEQEVKRRLFEEKVQREKQRQIERQKERDEREREIERIKKAHERELKTLKSRFQNSNGSELSSPVSPSKSNPYTSPMSPDANGLTSQRASSITGSCNFSLSKPNKVTITLPSYRLSGHGGDCHYEYEVKLLIGDDSWTIFRRYSRFRELHQHMKKRFPEVAVLAFPPKKMFPKKQKVAADRQKALEIYIQNLLDMCLVMPTCALHPSHCLLLSKQILCEFEPFFRKGLFEIGKHGTS